jgi:succinate dehydrogenase/fumarate reductase iron-sulfur protein
VEKAEVTVFRYNPETDRQPYYETHQYLFQPGMTVLDVVSYIYENIDGGFTFSHGCRNSHCGLCGAKINGTPGLMCREPAISEMTIEPLDTQNVIRDLMIDWRPYEACMSGLRLFLERTSEPVRQPERIECDDLEVLKEVSRCVGCYNCISICPAFQENKHAFLGPAGIVQLARHAFDPRDELNREIIAQSAGIERCTRCGKCIGVCPHGISPKKSVELLWIRLDRRR